MSARGGPWGSSGASDFGLTQRVYHAGSGRHHSMRNVAPAPVGLTTGVIANGS